MSETYTNSSHKKQNNQTAGNKAQSDSKIVPFRFPANDENRADYTEKIKEARQDLAPIISFVEKSKKRLRHYNMRYLPIKFEKDLTEFPSNVEIRKYNEANPDNPFPEITAKIKTKFLGEDTLEIGDLQGLKVKDKDTGELVPKYTDTEISMIMMSRMVTKWNLVDLDTGEEIEISPTSIAKLEADDFTYLFDEFTKALNGMNLTKAEDKTVEDNSPRLPDEAEKKLSETGLEPEKTNSENTPEAN